MLRCESGVGSLPQQAVVVVVVVAGTGGDGLQVQLWFLSITQENTLGTTRFEEPNSE